MMHTSRLQLRVPVYIAVASLITTLSCVQSAQAQTNLIRNGSFEGSLKYWIGAYSPNLALDTKNPAFGSHSVRVDGKRLISTPFPAKAGEPITISFSVRAAKPGRLWFNVRPSKRDTGSDSKKKFSSGAEIGTEWQRVSLTFTPIALDTGSNWLLDMGMPSAFWVDGVVLAPAKSDSYSPRRPVEVALDAPQLNQEGYQSNGNLLAKGANVPLKIAVSNPSPENRKLQVKLQLLNYSGERVLNEAVARSIDLAAGETRILDTSVTLNGQGLMLARAVIGDEQGSAIDQSDQPLTVLPLPKNNTVPNPAERLGASFRGDVTLKLGQQIGFGWSRWLSGSDMGWPKIQPNGAAEWKWEKLDREIQSITSRGMAWDYVLYGGVPKWSKADKAAGENELLPKDMQWKADDPRWDDLSLATSWDKYVTTIVKRYAGKPIAWEFVNEPDLNRGRHWEPYLELYRVLARRTYKLVKAANPNALFVVNATYPNVTNVQRVWARDGGAAFADAYSWHQYGTGPMGNAKTIRDIREFLDKNGGKKTQIWFNEGGTFLNSSQDYAANPLSNTSPAEWAHLTTRSIAEMLSSGEDKHIMFHIGYAKHGRSWFDWLTNGGTELWDENEQPMIGASIWNVLCDSLGLSRNVGSSVEKGVNAHIFQDERNGRGVVVAWSGDKTEKTLSIPLDNVIQRDVMGVDVALAANTGATTLHLPADGRPSYFFTSDKKTGEQWKAALTP